jgi:glycerol-3-phosphate cytidylyltransferase-like family protein
LEDAKKQGDILVVAVKDNKGASFKGEGQPIIDETQRIAIINGLKYVDYAVIAKYDEGFNAEVDYDNDDQKQWLQIFCKIFESLKPDMLYYEKNNLLQAARDRIFQKYNIKGIDRERTEIICTSKIINEIIRKKGNKNS